ncbi:hypothetical protein Pan44_30760 [Caulifigura coniformis]|uniref:Leucine Rich repeats (2 copies) n=2 Tax=Caulifigura coniformis TaxID=2527983 RepID=A0A517SFX4_9PLAN|nr:hypothetical protein Pan44_30760 [Caulifigura coniformis]
MVRERADLPTRVDDAAMVCIALDHPDQFSGESIRRFLAAFAGARIVCVRSPWCASLLRSRGDWPAAVIVDWPGLARRIQQEVETLRGERAPLPLTAGLEEIASADHSTRMPRTGSGGSARVVSADRAFRDVLTAQLQEAGYSVTNSGTDLCVVDGDPVEAVLPVVTELDASWPAEAPMVLLTADPATVAGLVPTRAVVASKFVPVGEWLKRLVFVVAIATAVLESGCREPGRPTETAVPAPQAGWKEQIEAVRTGNKRAISMSAPISDSDWKELQSGCEGLEVLELDAGVPQGADLSLLTGLPKLRRLKFGGDLTDSQATAVGRLPGVSELIVWSDSLTDAGAGALCRLPLVQLRLRAPLVTDAAMSGIGGLKQLRFLHLIDVPITDAALPALARLEALESLYLDRGKCTDEGLSALLKQRPDIHFHRDQTHLRDDPGRHEH